MRRNQIGSACAGSNPAVRELSELSALSRCGRARVVKGFDSNRHEPRAKQVFPFVHMDRVGRHRVNRCVDSTESVRTTGELASYPLQFAWVESGTRTERVAQEGSVRRSFFLQLSR